MNKKIAMLLLGLGCTYAFANPTPPTDPQACEGGCALAFRSCTAAGLPASLCGARVQSCLVACRGTIL